MRRSLFIVLVLLGGIPAAEGQGSTRLDVLAHASPLDYRGSRVKTQGWATGAYVYLGAGARHGLEAGAARTHINYRDSTSLDQSDFSFAYIHFGKALRWRLGGHLIGSDDALTDGAVTAFAGLAAYEPYTWSAGVNVYYTGYPDYTEPLSVLQVEPAVSWSFNDIARLRYLNVELLGRYVRLSKEVVPEEQSLFSTEARAAFSRSGWTVAVSVWSGEQAFSAREGGFMIYNLAEKHTGGYGVSIRRLLGSNAALTVGFHNEQFRDFGFPEEVSVNVLLIALGVSL